MVGGGFAPALRAARRFGRRRVRALPLQTTALSLSLRPTHRNSHTIETTL